MLRPRPVPLPGPFEVKNGLNTLSIGRQFGAGIVDRDHGVTARPDVDVMVPHAFVERPSWSR
jgi:hypothetical protein